MLDGRAARSEATPFAISQLNRVARQHTLATWVAIAIAFSCLLGIKAEAATFREMNDQVVLMEGEIQFGDDARLSQVLIDRNGRGLATQAIMLNSPGGFIQPAAVIAGAIRRMNMATIVASYAHCESACMLIFAAGTKRVAGEHAYLGVHSASAEQGESDYGTVNLAREMTRYGAPPAVAGKLVVTSSSDIAYLTPGDLFGWAEIFPDGQLGQPYLSYAPRPERPAQPPSPSSATSQMTCRSTATGNTYAVYFDGEVMRVGERTYFVDSTHIHNKTGALVVNGKTHVNTLYAAVFGGPNPRMGFSDGKEKAIDHCW